MSNYPPPPPFGAPFNSTALFAQSMSTNLPGIPQYSYGSLPNSLPHGGGALDAHYANTYYFNRNQQETNNHPNTMANSGPNMAVSQQSIAPLPNSSHSASRETSYLTQHMASASSNTQRSDSQLRLGLAHQIEAPMSPDIALPASAAAISDLEDGELSDDNGGEHSKVPNSDPTSYSRATVVSTELNSHGKPDHLSAVRHTAAVKAPAQHTGKDLAMHNESPQSSSHVVNSTSVDTDRRKQAKEALRLLYEHGLDYVRLAGEGINSALLEGLYAEMGIQISLRDSLTARGSSQQPAEGSENDGPRHPNSAISIEVGNNERLGPSVNGGLPNDSPSAAFGVTDGTSKLASTANGITAAERVSNGALSRKPSAQHASITVPQDPTSNSRSTHTSTKTGDKGYDRKDHIARMLAARAGKQPASTGTTSVLLSPASASKPSILQEPNPKPSPSVSSAEAKIPDVDRSQQTSADNMAASNPERHSETVATSLVTKQNIANNLSRPKEIMPSSPHLADFQAKKKAQTELARRKMEALMNRNSTKTQEEAVSQPAQPHVPTPNVLPTPASITTSHKPSPAITIPAASQATPTSRASFFSPTPGRQFSLPGLFMPSVSAVATTLDYDNKDTGTQLKQTSSTTSSSQQTPKESTHQVTLPSAPPKLSANKGPAETYISEAAHAVSPSNQMMEKSRKRPKAADFIDPPATRIKRLFGQNGDKSVVIEVSEDEALDGSLDDVIEDVDTDQNSREVGQVTVNGSRKIKQPVVSDALPQKRSVTITNLQASTGATTPQVNQTYGKDNGGLKSKEMEIELMKRRIAEVEQRRRAKQSSSRAQTPNTSKFSSPPKQSRASSEIVENSRAGSGPISAIIEVMDQAEGKDDAAPAGEKGPTNQELLLAEQLGLDTEQQPADKVDQRLQLGSDLKEHQHERSGIAKYRDRDRSEPRHEGSDRNQIFDEQPLQDLEERQAMLNEEKSQRRFEGQHARKGLSQSPGVDTQTIADEEVLPAVAIVCSGQREQRLAAINTEIPIVDAEICRIEQDLQQLQDKVNDLGTELHHLAESRRKLAEELQELSLERDALPGAPGAKVASNVVRHRNGNYSPGSHNATNSRDAISLMPDVETSLPGAFESNAPATPADPKLSGPGSSSASTSNGESEEDVMDISKSDLDEGEISEYAPQSIRSVVQSVEAEDAYEPPSNVDVKRSPPSLPSDLRISQQHSAGKPMDHLGPSSISIPQDDVEDHSNHQIPEKSKVATSPTNLSEQAENLNTRPVQGDSSNNIDESDDYEPPEPVSPSESAELENEMVAANDQLAYDILATATERQPTPVTNSEVPTTTRAATSFLHLPHERIHTKKEQKLRHFVPYESPLKQFKSYRYHRSFPTDVANGFRSLTYSNAIDPEQPICPFEIGGTCNDQQCPYPGAHSTGYSVMPHDLLKNALLETLRAFLPPLVASFELFSARRGLEKIANFWTRTEHFRNMGLSDNVILLQLGFAPEGLSPAEQVAYNEGLKNLIRDIRSRNVRDFNAMAADITTYRANFIGDTTKVLPL